MPLPSSSAPRPKGPVGVAEVRILKTKVIAEFLEGQRTTGTYEFGKDKVPENLTAGNLTAGKLRIEVSVDGQQIVSAWPAEGTHYVTFKEFTHAKDQPPIPKEKASKTVQTRKGGVFTIPGHLEFTAVLEVVKGKCKGMTLLTTLWYCFERWEDTTYSIYFAPPGFGREKDKWDAFANAFGIDPERDSIPFSENVLPDLETLLKSKKKALGMAKVENGWVQELFPAPEE